MSDPVPGGATILGSGLGRDSAIATRTEQRAGTAWAAYEERSFEAFRNYFEHLPRGKHVIEYSVRLNNPGTFALPPTRVVRAREFWGSAEHGPGGAALIGTGRPAETPVSGSTFRADVLVDRNRRLPGPNKQCEVNDLRRVC